MLKIVKCLNEKTNDIPITETPLEVDNTTSRG